MTFTSRVPPDEPFDMFQVRLRGESKLLAVYDWLPLPDTWVGLESALGAVYSPAKEHPVQVTLIVRDMKKSQVEFAGHPKV